MKKKYIYIVYKKMNNDAYKLKYMKYKAKYLELKNMLGGAEAEKYVVGMRVKRVKGDDDVYADGSIHRAEALGKYGIIKSIQEEKEWPPGSGKMLPKMYFIDFKNHYEGTKHEGVTIGVIEDDLELVPSYQGQQLSSRVPEMPGRQPRTGLSEIQYPIEHELNLKQKEKIDNIVSRLNISKKFWHTNKTIFDIEIEYQNEFIVMVSYPTGNVWPQENTRYASKFWSNFNPSEYYSDTDKMIEIANQEKYLLDKIKNIADTVWRSEKK
jgi:hypothetical protein